MTDLDRSKVDAYLKQVLNTFEAMLGHMEPGTSGNDRVLGAIAAMAQVQIEIDKGTFDT